MSNSRIIPDRDELRHRRIAAGLDQADLAELAGLHWAHISKLETGQRGTTARTLGKIARALKCEVTDLLPPRGAEITASAGKQAA